MKYFTIILIALIVYDLIKFTFFALRNWSLFKKAAKIRKEELWHVIRGMTLSISVIFTLLYYVLVVR